MEKLGSIFRWNKAFRYY